MTKAALNQNELRALRKLTGEPEVVSSSILSSSSSLLSSPCEAVSSMPVPDAPKNGVVVKISHAGACYLEGQSRNKRYTPQFPGNEVAGTIHEVGNNLPNANFTAGDRVMVIPNEKSTNTGFAEYIPVDDVSRILQIPNKVPLEVAAMLPGDALKAYAAVNCAAPHVEKLRKVKSCVNVLIIGGASLGLWSVKLAKYMMGRNCNNVRLFVADNSIDRLLTAQDHGCFDIIHWNEEDHEQYIVERTLDSCRGGVDVIIDYVGTNRTMQRCLKVLNREGLILVGGNKPCETSISLSTLAAMQQSIVGVPRGNINQLIELLNAVADKEVEVPAYKVFPVEDANRVFEEICECRITERAIFRFGSQSSGHLVDNH